VSVVTTDEELEDTLRCLFIRNFSDRQAGPEHDPPARKHTKHLGAVPGFRPEMEQERYGRGGIHCWKLGWGDSSHG
jgi:hypothetical protein